MTTNKNILIIGGGTAGWITANLFAKRWGNSGWNVTLMEAPDIPTIGVGEGSTPYLQKLFETLDIPEHEWMPKCNATYKTGIRFDNWSTNPGFESYFHPFISEVDRKYFKVFKQHAEIRRKGYQIDAHPDHFFLLQYLAEQKRHPQTPSNFPFPASYAYHFDAGKLGEILKDNAIKLGVKHEYAKVKNVTLHPSGDIAEICTDDQRKLQADLYVDCTGFNALLIEKALKVPFVSFKNNLLNDSAVALSSVYNKDYKPQTVSKALACGWSWEIPLTNRVGNGYVYSSGYLSKEIAEEELRAKLGNSALDSPARHIKMRVGRTSKHWHKNCLAIGLSQGFIEPLEATALHLVQFTVEQFIEQFEQDQYTNKNQSTFNDGINFTFERIRDYIVLHYLTNSRQDTQYWKDCRHSITTSDSLNQLMQVWLAGGDLEQELKRQDIDKYYGSLSWHVLLSGMGIFPANERLQPLPANYQVTNKEKIKEFYRGCALNYTELKSL